MIHYDSHIHTPFCPHGSLDSFITYIETAISKNLKGITFTEHAPLPKGFMDPTPQQDSAMKAEDLPEYLKQLTQLKKTYQQKIQILIGLEVDFIEGYEEEITDFLMKHGPQLDDSILSVHFLKHKQAYYCMDYSDDFFGEMISVFGSVEAIYDSYYATLKKSILAPLGPFKPRRIGHMTLVHKFQKRFPCSTSYWAVVMNILDDIKSQGLSLDYNSAGLVKPLCEETYPPETVAIEAQKRKIPLVYGSDAHSAKGLLQGSNTISQDITLSAPTITST
ncbi:histidinol-phosphatase HisJ [Bacillus alkalicellulosilyticus]|uniref:histidinol-phosphatase HisJ n=1 Tax=Alkalihalobacterium alkalicellulosilyticum TaxID=1912214 RepID=UPI0009978BDE|nr:histidinol-phosphatase HisJ [Bacillus alkalicellulosilyticus]